MAAVEDFKYFVNAERVQATHDTETVEVSKVKFFCIYEGLSLKIMLRFGKGTDHTSQNITAIFEFATKNLDELHILSTFRGTAPIQELTWCCNYTPLIWNYSKRADPKQAEHRFTEILQLPGKKKIKLLAPMIKKFWIDEWDKVITTYSTQSKDMEAMLALYPNPSRPGNSLPPIAECRLRAGMNSFANREIWRIVMMTAVLREREVYLRRTQKTNVENCWGYFIKKDNSIFCNVFAEPVGHDKPQILNPSIGDKMRLYLRHDGYHELSVDATTNYTQAVITDVTKHSDFVLRILGLPSWTEKDINFDMMSTIRLERTNIYMAITRHQEAVENCYNTALMTTSFPLKSLLLLNQRLPSVCRAEITQPVWENLRYIDELLNPTQRQAFRECHESRSPIVLIQGPPGTGKTLTLAMIAISFAMARGLKCLIATPSNNAANEICEKILAMWAPGSVPQKRPGYVCPNIVRWLTPVNDQSIMNNARAPGIPDSMAKISMARKMQDRIRQIISKGEEWEKTVAIEWLDLWRHRKVLKETQLSRFKELTYLWEKRCLRETDIVVTTCDNSYTLDPDAFTASIVIVDECSQAIEPAALLPIIRFIKTLELVVLGGDDQQLQPFILSTTADNEFQPQLRKSWFERVRLSTVVPCFTLGQQYRMRPEISRIIISHFYPDKLQNDKSTSEPRLAYVKYMELAKSLSQRKPEWAASQWPVRNVLMIDMPEGARTFSKLDGTQSRYNSGHILIVRDLCLTLLAPSSGISDQELAIITPYAAQRVRHIRALKEAAKLNPALSNVVVSTVDKFQGQECSIVILDLVVRSDRDSAIGFMKDKNRLNVAISRARDVLIVVGDAHGYKRLLSKPKVIKQTRLFLEIMCDIATHTMLWKGDTSDIKDIHTWDAIEGGDNEGESDGKGEKIGDFQNKDTSLEWKY
jgi:hypothetical protein